MYHDIFRLQKYKNVKIVYSLEFMKYGIVVRKMDVCIKRRLMPSLIRLGKCFLTDAELNLNISMHELINAIQFLNSLNYPYGVTSHSHSLSLFISHLMNDFGGGPNLIPL